MTSFDAVVLAGGTARRLGGVDKMLVEVGGARLIDRAVASVHRAGRIVVVGEPRDGVPDVVWAQEHPPGGGPVAGLAAGLALVEAPMVVLLAADLAFVSEPRVQALLDAVEDRDGAMYRGPDGRDQTLFSAWRTDALRAVLPAEPAGAAVHRTLASLAVTRLTGDEHWLADIDTPADLESARRHAKGEGP